MDLLGFGFSDRPHGFGYAVEDHARALAELVDGPGGGFFSLPIAAQPEARYVASGHAATLAQARAQGNVVWAGTLLASSPVAVHRGAFSLVRGSAPTWLEQLEALVIPRCGIYGARSLPDPDARRLEAIGVPLRVVPDAGHSVAWENPSGLAAAIAAALPL